MAKSGKVNRALSIRSWKDLHKFFAYFDKVLAKIPDGKYSNILKGINNSTEEKISAYKDIPESDDVNELKKDIENHFGFPVPDSLEALKERNRFQNMPLYYNIHNELQPLLEELAKNSSMNIPLPKLKANDRELGTFSFERAMMMPTQAVGFYSVKHKKQVSPSEIKKEGNGYVLKYDGSKIEIRQEIDAKGNKKISTDNKASFLYKAPVTKPHRAVQLFINITVNWEFPAYYAGITGMAIAKYLESRGYAVGITMVCGIMDNGRGMMHNGKLLNNNHTRYLLVELKEVGGGYDTLTTLYALADGSCFRHKIFRDFVAQQYEYRDTPNSTLGKAVDLDIMEEDLRLAIKKRDIFIAQNALEFFIGGNDLVRLDQAKEQIIHIVTKSEAINLLTMARIMPDMMPPLREALHAAIAAKQDIFIFNGTQIGVEIARKMIDYLQQQNEAA